MQSTHIQEDFTLIEVLTVCTIISLLLALLLPALSRAQEKARQVQCFGNFHQLTLAFLQYSDDWAGRLPPYVTNAPSSEHPGLNWAHWSYPYYQNVRVLLCPASSGKVPETTDEGFRAYDGSYGWNYDGTQGNRGPLTTHIASPSQGYLLMDSGDPCLIYGANTWENLLEELDLDWDSGPEGCNRHLGAVNIGFVDGHVASRGLWPFLAAPCRTGTPPWYMIWEGGELSAGRIPYPVR